MISVQVSAPLEEAHTIKPELQSLLEETVRAALRAASDRPEADVTLVLSDDAQLQELNRTYLGVDAPTDVLSFPSGEIDPETDAYYLGDVIISYPRAAAQAAAGNYPVEAELQLLVVHGTLHLCGYDHAEPDEKVAMWEIQAEILRGLNCPILGPSSELDA